MRVLVVDDSIVVRERLVEILSTLQGVEQVDTAGRVSEARQAIQSAPPDVIVLDIHMPGGSGIEVLEALRADDRRIMTIVLTNDPAPQWRAASLRAGADFFFDKSSEFQQAVDVVARLALGRPAPGSSLPPCWTYFERLPIPTWIFDVDTLEFKAVNDAAVRRYGYSREEFLTMTMADIRPPELVPAMWEQIGRRRSGERVPWIGMRQHRAKDGTPIYVEICPVPFDSEGRRLDLVLVHDISERVLAEEALRASENRYRDLFENATDAIFTTDLDLNFTSLNSVAEALTGYTREEATHVNVAALLAPDALGTVRDELANQLAGKPASMFEVPVQARDGRTVPIEINARLVRQDGKPVGIQGIGRDISERKRLERGLRQAQKMEAIGRLAGGVAHDFNNLLTVIIGHSQEMIERFTPDDPAHAEAVQIFTAGECAADLTRQLLAFSRQQILAPKVLDLNAVVSRLAPMLRRLIGEDIDLVIRTGAAMFAVKADPGQLEQVIMNLAVNARDAMPETGTRTLTIDTTNVEVDARDIAGRVLLQPGQYVVLVVRDTGLGMDASVKAHLFEPFFTVKEAGRGTGLGLSTVYAIVKQSGGYILVDSEPGQGTTFSLYFPYAAGPIESAFPPPAGQRSERGHESILIVEDDRAVREFARRALTARGYEVLVAASPSEARRLCDAHPREIGLLLTDIVMPGMTGQALAGVLRERHAQMKVVYMSGYAATDATVDRGVGDPSVPFIGKPFTASGLAAKVREVLDSA